MHIEIGVTETDTLCQSIRTPPIATLKRKNPLLEENQPDLVLVQTVYTSKAVKQRFPKAFPSYSSRHPLHRSSPNSQAHKE